MAGEKEVTEQEVRDAMEHMANQRQVGGTHYKTKMEHWDYVIANNIPYMEAQIIKYVGRHQDKGGVQDLYKAQHFLEKLLETEEAKLAELKAKKVMPRRRLPGDAAFPPDLD